MPANEQTTFSIICWTDYKHTVPTIGQYRVNCKGFYLFFVSGLQFLYAQLQT